MEHKGADDGSEPSDYSFCTLTNLQTPEQAQLRGKRKSNCKVRRSTKKQKSLYPKLDMKFIKVVGSAKNAFPDVGMTDDKKFSFYSDTSRKVDSPDSPHKSIGSIVRNNHDYSKASLSESHKVDLLNLNRAKGVIHKNLFPSTSYEADKTENSTPVRADMFYYKSNIKGVETLKSKKRLDNDNTKKHSLDFALTYSDLKTTKRKNNFIMTNEGSRQMELEQSILEATPPSAKSRKMKKKICNFQEINTDQFNNNASALEITPIKIGSCPSPSSSGTKYCAKMRAMPKKRLAIIVEDEDAVIPPTPPKQKNSKDVNNICAELKNVSSFQKKEHIPKELNTILLNYGSNNSKDDSPVVGIKKCNGNILTAQKSVTFEKDHQIEDTSSSESEISGQYMIETEVSPEKPKFNMKNYQIENSQVPDQQLFPTRFSVCSFMDKCLPIEDFSSQESENKCPYIIENKDTPKKYVFHMKNSQIEYSPNEELLTPKKIINHQQIEVVSSPESENNYFSSIQIEHTPERPDVNMKDFQIECSPRFQELLTSSQFNSCKNQKIEDLSSQESDKCIYNIETEETPKKSIYNASDIQIESSPKVQVLFTSSQFNCCKDQEIEDLSSQESDTFVYNIETEETPEKPIYNAKVFQKENSPKVQVLLTSSQFNSCKNQKIEDLSSQESDKCIYNIETEETLDKSIYNTKVFQIESSPKVQLLRTSSKINSSTYHKIEDLSSPESVMKYSYTIETEETPERPYFNLNCLNIENSPSPNANIFNKNKLEISYTFGDDDQIIEDLSLLERKTDHQYMIETEESPEKTFNMTDFKIEDSLTPSEVFLSGSFMPASQVIDILPDYFMKNMKIEISQSLSQIKHPKEKNILQSEHKSSPCAISLSQSVINTKRNLFAKEKSDILNVQEVVQNENTTSTVILQPPKDGPSSDKIDNEEHMVENRFPLNLKKNSKSSLLLKKAYKVVSKIRKNQNLFAHEVKSGLRSLTGKQTALLELISSHYSNNVYYLSCKSVHDMFDSLKVKKVIVVANGISTKISNIKYVIVHFPVTLIFSPKLDCVTALVDNRIHLVENINFDKKENRIASISHVNNFTIKNLDNSIVRTLQSNLNNSVFDIVIGQLLMTELVLNLIIIHLFYIEKDSFILCLDAEQQFCLLCFSGQDSEKIQSKKSLYDGSTIVTKGFCFIGTSQDKMIKSLFEYSTGKEVQTDQFFVLVPAVENWEVKSTTRPLAKWKSTTPIETVLSENNSEKRYRINVPSVIYKGKKVFICDKASGTKCKVEHFKKGDPFVKKSVSILDGVFYRNRTLLVDRFTKVIYS